MSAPSEDSGQPGHPPSLIRVFAVCMKKARVLSYPLSAQRRLWSDWVDASVCLSLRWAHTHFVCFVMLWLIPSTIMILSFWTDRAGQTVQTQIRLLLGSTLFAILSASFGRITSTVKPLCSNFRFITANFRGSDLWLRHFLCIFIIAQI